jgi:hypothetical protein
VEFSGEFSGSQLVVGEHNVINRYEGTVVQTLAAGAVSTPVAQPRPQMRLPRARDGLLGRDREVRAARQALSEHLSVEFWGPAGIGKTSLLTELALAPGASWSDGVVHARVAGQPLEDVLQWLFEVYWATEPRWVPGRVRVGEYLRELQMLLVLDDVGFTSDETTELMDACAQATCVLAGTEPSLDVTQPTVALRGLPGDAGRAAFQRALRRPLEHSESAQVAELVSRFEGVPALVTEAARMVREEICGLDDLADQPVAELDRRRILPLTDAQRRVLALLIDLAPVAVPVDLLCAGAEASVGDAEALERVALAESNSPRYALARPLAAAPRAELASLDAEPVIRRLVAAAQRRGVDSDAAPALAAAMAWGLRAGASDAVVDLARSIDGALLVARRTGAWGTVIASGLAAARQVGRTGDEAYFLHQHGTRWLCGGEIDRGQEALRQALALRERLGDDAGTAATRHNLGQLPAGRPVRAGGRPMNGSRGGPPLLRHLAPRWWLRALAMIVAAGAGVGVGLAVAGGSNATTKTVIGTNVTVITKPAQTITDSGTTHVVPPETITERGSTTTASGSKTTTTATLPASTTTSTATTTATLPASTATSTTTTTTTTTNTTTTTITTTTTSISTSISTVTPTTPTLQ